MIRVLLLLLVLFQLVCPVASADSGNPFHATMPSDQAVQKSSPHNSFLTKIALYQQHLKQKMASMIRQINTAESMYPLLAVMLIAFGYGVIHAAGPGHGKAVAMSYMMSRNPSIANGVLFGTLIAFTHGFSGALCVLGLHYVLKQSVTGTLITVSHVTQLVSFSLITLLGIAILVKNVRELFLKTKSSFFQPDSDSAENKKKFLPWAMAVGLVPCPGVVMVMLFCLSMDVMLLGLILAVCISLGMAVTISFVVTAVVVGKTGILSAASKKRTEIIEGVVGILSGTAISLLGTLFLLTTIHSASF
jgi:nickel/cobalt exporter